jgi:HEAT repeat protein
MPHGLIQTRHLRHGRGRLIALLLLALTAAALVFLPGRSGRTAQRLAPDLDRLNRFVQAGDSPAMQVFRQGRDLIEREDWAAAATKFEGYVAQYPKSKEADAALYWLAYARKKQGRFQDTQQTLERLVREFPRSTWVDDARAMEVEIAPQVGKRVEPDGMDDELKMVALQSLFQSDPVRAAQYAADILKPGSKASQELKETAVSLLGQRGGPEAASMLLDIARTQADPELRGIAIHRLGQTNDESVIDELMKIYEAERDRDVKGQVLHAFSQMNSPRAYAKLLEIARGSGGDAELRQTAIHWIGQRNEAQAVDDLMRILSTERDDEVRASVLHAFAQINDPRAQARLLEVARDGAGSVELRAQAIHWLGQRKGGATVDELMGIYRADKNEEIRGAVLHALSQQNDPRARASLFEIARGGDDPEMRAQAIHALTQFDDAATLEDLFKLYDAERDEDVKAGLLHAFSESKQERALLKLMEVARGDASREMRKQAIHWLGQSQDPRATKLLQDLLR